MHRESTIASAIVNKKGSDPIMRRLPRDAINASTIAMTTIATAANSDPIALA